jgi:hypothetical protein
MLCHVVWWKFTDVSETASTSEMSVNFYWTTRHNIPEDSHPHFEVYLKMQIARHTYTMTLA